MPQSGSLWWRAVELRGDQSPLQGRCRGHEECRESGSGGVTQVLGEVWDVVEGFDVDKGLLEGCGVIGSEHPAHTRIELGEELVFAERKLRRPTRMINCPFQRATVTEQDCHVLMLSSSGQCLHPDSR